MTRVDRRTRTRAAAASVAFGLAALAVCCGAETALAQSSGDFNGDGYDDLAIGIPGEDNGTISNAGAVAVLYGTENGLTAVGSARLEQGGGPGDLRGEAEMNDRFGSCLAVGDFNGDGFDDLAIGVPSEDSGSAANSGAVNVVYGSASGLTLVGNQYWDEDMTGVDDRAEPGDFFGSSLAAGDFNGDGNDDLAVGVRGQDVQMGIPDSGSVHVLYGASVIGLTANGDQVWHQDTPGLKGVAGNGDYFGWALAAADFDADGRDDLAIGILNEDAGDVQSCGAVQVLYGTSNGLSDARDQLWDQGSSGVPGARESGDSFGSALAAGDLNGDGADDLAVGVPFESDESAGLIDTGAVNVLYGVPGVGLGTAGAQILAQLVGSFGDLEFGDLFGLTLAIGRLTSDHRADLVVGVQGEDNFMGAANIYVGSPAGVLPRRFLRANVLGGAQEADTFAAAISIGDFDGDGVGNVAFGVPGDDVISESGDEIFNAGSVTVSGRAWSYWTKERLWDRAEAESGDSFGHSLSR